MGYSQRSGWCSYTIDPGNRGDYDLLLRALQSTGDVPRSVMHLWNVTGPPEPPSTHERDLCFYSLLYLAQAWSDHCGEDPLNLVVVTNGLQSVCSSNEPLHPAKALVLGPCKVIPQEYPAIACRCVDVAVPEDSGAHLAESLLREVTRPATAGVVAYRRKHRWEQIFEPLRLPAPSAGVGFRARGVYVITGGLGGMGLTFARDLAETVQARLVLIGRSPLPPRENWENWLDAHAETDPTSERIRQIRELEALGAEVMVLAADVSDYSAMKVALDLGRQRFGRFDIGAIHAAGIARGGLIQLTTPEMAEPVLAPKVDGTLILESLLREDNPDFLLLCSSVNGICGGVGAVDYASANAFLDAFALSRAGHNSCAVLSVNWDTWQQIGMAVNTSIPTDLRNARLRALESGIKPAEGVRAFRRVVSARLPQVAVVARDLRALLDRPVAAPNAGEAAQPPASNLEPSHSRPELGRAYAEAETEAQQRVVEIWKEVLGIHQIGIDDNFFVLGGHSLLATGVLSRIRSTLGVSLPLRTAFEAPTVRELADRVETVLWAAGSKPQTHFESEREEIEL